MLSRSPRLVALSFGAVLIALPIDAQNPELNAAHLKTKRAALAQYKSQMDVMGWFLNGFARRNEWFSRPAPPRVALPVRRSPCDDFS